MPGLLTLRPLASATKAAKSTVAKNAAVSAARADKGRDDARPQGQGRAVSPAFSRARVLRAPALHHGAPTAHAAAHHHPAHYHFRRQSQQQQHVAPAQAQKQLAVTQAASRISSGATTTEPATDLLVGHATAAAAPPNQKQFGVDINRRVGGVDYSSSGSEHEPNSVCLAEMVYDYIADDLEVVSKCGRTRCNCGNSCSGGDLSSVKENDDSSLGGEISDVLQGLKNCVSPCEKMIVASVTSALAALGTEYEDESEVGEKGRPSTRSPSTRRSVMSALRSSGYNAAICKSRWEHAGGFPGGDYEYIDVVVDVAGKKERIVVDVDFKAQFEIARPTGLYSALLQSLPSIYVGKVDRLQQIVNIMCDSAKRSLKKRGLHLPPWRKPEYIRAKWFSAYRRTTNGASSSPTKSPDRSDIGQIALRNIGWDSKFTTEMEKCYVKVADLKMALRECTVEQVLELQPPEPEGKVRGANLMRFLGLGSDYSTTAGDGDLTMATEWEPPSVIPRNSTQRATTGKVGGLVSILKESSPGLLKEGTLRVQELQEQVEVAALPRRQAGALSKQMAVV